MTSNIITLRLDTTTTDANAIKNAVRRALSTVETLEGSGEVKGVRYSVQARKTEPTQASIVRAWAVKKGMEVGARGRIKPEVLAAFAAAHKA